ncbi:hypothetical protein BO99DRAFT_409082 [Aspergillus violaceofuscus CBS 115571]|uniref:Hydrophobin n=1 Tax=Aspergillus violaceofuscus (strain CBS 115571) TaxID=1450538 RepID=A0A2V5HGF8_ASPV1|nr:hypothetical protein BO99DRAFT_409082 [Aspergillus violaceofuscus CBS 115571]
MQLTAFLPALLISLPVAPLAQTCSGFNNYQLSCCQVGQVVETGSSDLLSVEFPAIAIRSSCKNFLSDLPSRLSSSNNRMAKRKGEGGGGGGGGGREGETKANIDGYFR